MFSHLSFLEYVFLIVLVELCPCRAHSNSRCSELLIDSTDGLFTRSDWNEERVKHSFFILSKTCIFVKSSISSSSVNGQNDFGQQVSQTLGSNVYIYIYIYMKYIGIL